MHVVENRGGVSAMLRAHFRKGGKSLNDVFILCNQLK
jgi:hypothetical protein